MDTGSALATGARPSSRPPFASSVGCSLINVLFVCTANQCRSPMAESILRSLLTERGIDWPVASVGLLEAGFPMVKEALAALGPDGAAMVGHRSRTLSKSDVVEADIIFGMAREHVREVAVLDPEAWGRTFTLKEFVRRSQTFPAWIPDRPFAAWLAGIHQGRQRDEMQGDSPNDDVADPIGGTPADFAATARLLRNLCGKVTDRIAPGSSPARTSPLGGG
ncbi:MAG: hypothetical protein ACRDWB_08485 [Acidimicrobiales bacterium]